MATKQLHRRTVLRGVGTAIGLPLLEAMTMPRARASAQQAPLRVCFLYVS